MRLTIAAAAVLASSVDASKDASSAVNINHRALWKTARDNGLLPNTRKYSSRTLSKQKSNSNRKGFLQRRRHLKRQQQVFHQRRLKNVINTEAEKDNASHVIRECDPNAPVDVGILSCGENSLTQYCQESLTSTLGGVCVDLQNMPQGNKQNDKKNTYYNHGRLSNSQKQQQRRECDPFRQNDIEQDDADAADVGILSSCEPQQYCQRNQESTMGGFCADLDVNVMFNDHSNIQIPMRKRIISQTSRKMLHTPLAVDATTSNLRHRNLQDESPVGFDDIAAGLCSSANYTCSMCTYGEAVTKGYFDCVYAEDYCKDIDSFCGSADNTTQACYNYGIEGVKDGESQTLTICTQLKSPAQLEYCYSRILTGEEYSCAFKVNDEFCQSCQIGPEQDGYDDCFIFDCENTGLPISGNTCTYDFDVLVNRAIQEAILPCDSGCTMCLEGELVGNPDAIVTLATGEVDCSALAIAASTGYGPFFDPEYCAGLNALAGEICGCYNPTDGVYEPPSVPPDVATDTPTTDGTSAPTEEEVENEVFFDVISGKICLEGSGYNCTTCDVDMEARTANFDCVFPSYCEPKASFCLEPLDFCFEQRVKGSVTNDETYEFTYCSTIQTRPGEKVYEFNYCINYSIMPTNATCGLSVDGIDCSSCTVEMDTDTQYAITQYNCENTVLGRSGDNFGDSSWLTETEDYFSYRALPCAEGCNLCGGDALMTDQNATFDRNGVEQICFQAQFEALVGPTDLSVCEDVGSLVQDPCSCKAPSTPAPTVAPAPDSSLAGSGAVTFGGSKVAMFATVVAFAGAAFTSLASGL